MGWDGFDAWLEQGRREGWCGPVVCVCHDGVPTSSEEDELDEEWGEVCIPMVRVYDSPEVRVGVEANHSPSVWRR